MTQAMTESGQLERKLAHGLRDRAVRAINERDDLDAVAARLDLGKPGLEALLSRTEWPLDQAVRVAGALEIIDESFLDKLLDEPQ